MSPNSPQIQHFSLCFIFKDIPFPRFFSEYAVDDDEQDSSESELDYESPSMISNHIILCAHEAVNKEVDGAVNNEEEVLDGSKAEHPAWMGWEHAHTPAQVGPLTYS